MRTFCLVAPLLTLPFVGCASRLTPPSADTTAAIESIRTEVNGLDQESQELASFAQRAEPVVQVNTVRMAALEQQVIGVTAERDQAHRQIAVSDAAAAAQRAELESARVALAQSQGDYDEAKRSLSRAVELLKQRDDETIRLKGRVQELEARPATTGSDSMDVPERTHP